MQTTHFWLIRHGQTDWNAEQRLQGWRDMPLNAIGKEQALAVRRFLDQQDVQFDAVLSSDLQRAIETAEIALEGHSTTPLPLIQDASLRERNYGIYEGHPWRQLLQLPDEPAPEINLRDPNTAVPEGETLTVFHDRIITAFDRIATERPGQQLAVIAHGGVIDMVWRKLQHLGLTTLHPMRIMNASVNHFSINNQQQWHEIAWAQTDHL